VSRSFIRVEPALVKGTPSCQWSKNYPHPHRQQTTRRIVTTTAFKTLRKEEVVSKSTILQTIRPLLQHSKCEFYEGIPAANEARRCIPSNLPQIPLVSVCALLMLCLCRPVLTTYVLKPGAYKAKSSGNWKYYVSDRSVCPIPSVALNVSVLMELLRSFPAFLVAGAHSSLVWVGLLEEACHNIKYIRIIIHDKKCDFG
jgi:hypothetical protein